MELSSLITLWSILVANTLDVTKARQLHQTLKYDMNHYRRLFAFCILHFYIKCDNSLDHLFIIFMELHYAHAERKMLSICPLKPQQFGMKT